MELTHGKLAVRRCPRSSLVDKAQTNATD